MPDPRRKVDFLEKDDKLFRCRLSRNFVRTLERKAVENDRNENGDIIYTRSLMTRVFTKSRVSEVLGCECSLCKKNTQETACKDDDTLAAKIIKEPGHQKLIVALALMGGTFAVRQLNEHTCDTLEKTLDGIPNLPELRQKLFARFRLSHCPHNGQHISGREDESLICFGNQFLVRLQNVCWRVSVPTFQADNQLKIFRTRQNMPFVNQVMLENRCRDSNRRFYKFTVHESHCDESLKDQILFRKQVSTSSDVLKREIHCERNNLQFLKDVHHDNIAEVVFAFSEMDPPSFSLVFKYYPADLQQVLYKETLNIPEFKLEFPSPNRFVGSALDNWLWVGVLGILDALAVVHEPQNHTQTIPKMSNERLLGGHFDIKPANILIESTGRFLLTDFGQSYFKKIRNDQQANFTIGAHTQQYLPPRSFSKPKLDGDRQVDGKRWWTQEYDIWGLACVCVEVLSYIIDGEDGPTMFYNERKEEGDGTANFWKCVNGRDEPKEAVIGRLRLYRQGGYQTGDKYLTDAASQVEKMFYIQKDKPLTVEVCRQELSTRIDRYMLKRDNDEEIASEGTKTCLNQMQISFSTESVSHRCSLYLWTNAIRGQTTLTIECIGSEGQTMVWPSRARNAFDEFIPIPIFTTNTIPKVKEYPIKYPSLRCAFRNLHDGVTFRFARQHDYNHFFGAVTHQRVLTGSEFHLSSCKVWFRKKESYESHGAHCQIWENLPPAKYASRYIEPAVPTIKTSEALTPQSITSDNRSSTDTNARNLGFKKPTKREIRYFRLVLYLKTSSAFVILVISLTHDTFYRSFDESNSKARVTLERKRDQDEIRAASYERRCSATNSPNDLDLISSADEYPGIPLDPKVLAEHMERGSGLKKVEIGFLERADQELFRKCYMGLFGG